MKQKGKGELSIAKFFFQDFSVCPEPFAAKEEVFWGLFDATAAERAVYLVQPVEVCFVVPMAYLELVECTGYFPLCSPRDPGLSAWFPAEFGGVGVWVAADGFGG